MAEEWKRDCCGMEIVTDPSLGKPSELSVVVVNDAQESSSSFVLKETLGESLPYSIHYLHIIYSLTLSLTHNAYT